MTEDEMVGWHHLLNKHEFEQALGNGEGQGSLVCCSPWTCKELDMTEQLINNVTSFCDYGSVIEDPDTQITHSRTDLENWKAGRGSEGYLKQTRKLGPKGN